MDQNYLGETHPKDGSKIMPKASSNGVWEKISIIIIIIIFWETKDFQIGIID